MATAVPHADSKLEQDVEDLAALVDLIERVAAAGDSATACHAATSELQDYLGCGQVAVGLVRRSGSTCRLKAIAGQADFDRTAVDAGHRNRTRRSCCSRRRGRLAPGGDADRHGLAAQRQLADLSGAAAVLTVPLARCGESPIGACTVLSAGEPEFTAHQQRFIKACAGPLAAALSAARRGEQRPWLRALKRVAAEKIAPPQAACGAGDGRRGGDVRAAALPRRLRMPASTGDAASGCRSVCGHAPAEPGQTGRRGATR